MRDAAKEERYEEAARYRNRLFAIRSLAERQAADKRAVGTVDVIGVAAEGDRAAVQVFPLRDGELIDRYAFHLENVDGQDLETILESFCLEYYGSAPSVPPQIVVPAGHGRRRARWSGFSPTCAAPASRCARRSVARSAASPSWPAENARARARRGRRVQAEQRRLRRIEALETLREALNLESLPLRIECFDVSNIQGTSIVGSMVVFQDAQRLKAHYRAFSVKGQEGQDDFAAMAQIVSRRFARLRDAASPDRWDESFALDAEPRRRRRRQAASSRPTLEAIQPRTTFRGSP